MGREVFLLVLLQRDFWPETKNTRTIEQNICEDPTRSYLVAPITYITIVAMPDITVGPICIVTLNKTPGTIINKFSVSWIRVSAIVDAAQLFIFYIRIPWLALISFSCDIHLAFVCSSITFSAVNVYDSPIYNSALGYKLNI